MSLFCTFTKVQVRQLHSTQQSATKSCVYISAVQGYYRSVAFHLFITSYLDIIGIKVICLLIIIKSRDKVQVCAQSLTMSFMYEVNKGRTQQHQPFKKQNQSVCHTADLICLSPDKHANQTAEREP